MTCFLGTNTRFFLARSFRRLIQSKKQAAKGYTQQRTGAVDQHIKQLHCTAGNKMLVNFITDSIQRAGQPGENRTIADATALLEHVYGCV